MEQRLCSDFHSRNIKQSETLIFLMCEGEKWVLSVCPGWKSKSVELRVFPLYAWGEIALTHSVLS